MARLGMTLASPQKVIGPAAAAVNSSVAAGASPIPTSSSAATSGISKSRGTLISRPTVAAMATPAAWLPARVETVSASIHWMTRPLAKPAMTMMGPRRRRYFRLERTQARPASDRESFQVDPSGCCEGGSAGTAGSERPSCPAANAAIGPMRMAPATLRRMRVPPIMGAKTIAVMTRAGQVQG